MDGNWARGLGFLTGLMLGLLVVAFLLRKKVVDFTFDERQQRARGVAYKWGFWTMAAVILALGVSEVIFGRWCDSLTGAMLCFCVGGGVFAVTCITKDAYQSLKEQPKKLLILLTAALLVNLACGVSSLLDGGVVEGGVLTFRATNLFCVVLVAVILAAYAASLRRKAGEEEE